MGGIGVAIYVLILHSRIGDWKRRAQSVIDTNKYRKEMEAQLQEKDAETRRRQAELAEGRAKLAREADYLKLALNQTERVYPWAARIHGDLLAAEANSLSRMLERKKHPAFRASEQLQAFKNDARERLQHAKYAEYKALVYEDAFPFLIDFIEGAPTSELAVSREPRADGEDPARQYLTEAEYTRLSTAERSQRALERYLSRGKSNWEVGRDYERYIGYHYEKLGWEVEFHGAIRGLEDLGRDLIARGRGQTCIIQCKYWAQWKDVHENAVFQLFGSVVDYVFQHDLVRAADDVFQTVKEHGVHGHFVTSTSMSERALIACKALGIKPITGIPLDRDYPRIKCNIGRTEKLYHLPLDQQYDRIKIVASNGEFYARTAAEAEAAGFRRVYRWKPQADT